MWNTQTRYWHCPVGTWCLPRGNRFDAVSWPDDMGFKLNPILLDRDVPRLAQAGPEAGPANWGALQGDEGGTSIRAAIIRPFVPELIEIGVDMLNPIEVKGGYGIRSL